MFAATDITPIVQVNVLILSFVAGSVVPLVVALLTKSAASQGTKAVVNLILSVVGGVVAFLIAHDGTASVLQVATVAVTAYLASGSTYSHLWKPTGAITAVQAVAPNTGLG